MTRLYVGNLLPSVTLDDLRDLFSTYGAVYEVDLHTENEPGRPHAFAFIEMDEENAEEAIEALDATAFLGRTLRVEKELAEQAPRA